jgi:hypothetical protein
MASAKRISGTIECPAFLIALLPLAFGDSQDLASVRGAEDVVSAASLSEIEMEWN